MANEKLLDNAKHIWKTLGEHSWDKDSLIELGKKMFARIPWDKLDQATKLIFIKTAVGITPDDTKVVETPPPVPAKTESPNPPRNKRDEKNAEKTA